MSAPPLPANCAGCSYARPGVPKGLLCVRHGPSPTSEPVHVAQTFEVVHWPHVRPGDRCGAGADRSAANAPTLVTCEGCLHWFQPGGIGIVPDFIGTRTAAWWQGSGFCTRFSPSPSVEEDMHAQWRITHSSDRCGDCEPVNQEEDDGEVAQELHPAHDQVPAQAIAPLTGPR